MEHTVRGKMVRLGDVEANVRVDGSVHVRVVGEEINMKYPDKKDEVIPAPVQELNLSEKQTIDLAEVLDDITDWVTEL